MFRLLLFVSAVTLAAALPASGQTRIDVSSPDAVMADLRGLAERWTHRQFFEVMRAAVFASLPDYGADPTSFRQGRSRWSRYAEGVGLSILIVMEIPLYLEGDPFIGSLEPEVFERQVHKAMARVLEGRTIEELVALGRDRERVVLTLLQEDYQEESRGLEQEIEEARVVLSRPGASVQDAYRLRRVERRLARAGQAFDLMSQRLRALETGGPFTPGASDCRLGEVMHLTAEQTIAADLETLADTCPQRELIAFLRAAAILSEVPAGLAHPGARMHPEALREAEQKVIAAMRAISWLAALFQLDNTTVFPTSRTLEALGSQREQVAGTLRRALAGRTVSEMIREGERVEAAFLVALRDHYARQLRIEV